MYVSILKAQQTRHVARASIKIEAKTWLWLKLADIRALMSDFVAATMGTHIYTPTQLLRYKHASQCAVVLFFVASISCWRAHAQA